jgi:hypothetical protein
MASQRRSKKPKRKTRARTKALTATPAATLRQAMPASALAGGDLFELMGNMMARSAELPIRLLRARSPLEVWQEQVRFIESVGHAYRLAARMTVMPSLSARKPIPKRRKRGR